MKRWAKIAKEWSAGNSPAGLSYVEKPRNEAGPRDVFVFFIDSAKVRAPAAAQALLRLVDGSRADQAESSRSR